MDKQPAEYDLSDVTSRTELHAEMNRHMSWAINLALMLDCRTYYDRLISGRSFLAGMIDNRASDAVQTRRALGEDDG